MKHLVFDTELKRPACALLQVIYGGDAGIANEFPVEQWLTSPTPNMKCYLVDDDLFKQIVRHSEAEERLRGSKTENQSDGEVPAP